MKQIMFVACISLIVAASMVGCNKEVDSIGVDTLPTQESRVIEVTFDEPTDLQGLAALVESGVHVVQVRATMIDNHGGEYTYGKSMADDEQIELASLRQEAAELFAHQEGIAQQVIEEGRKQGIDEADLGAEQVERKLVRLDISYLMLEVSHESREELTSALEGIGGRTRIWEPEEVERQSKQPSEEVGDRAVKKWMPNAGSVATADRNSSQRYVYQRVRWLNRSPFQRWYTYEHDFFLNNYSNHRGTYLARDQNSQGFPICSWISTLPAAYLDTRLGDPSTEVAYTIGCGDAYRIKAQEWYSSTIYVRKGDVNRDVGKLNAQLGTQIPVGCTSVWCSYAVETQRLIPAWKLTNIPGTQWWYYGV